MKKRNNSPVKDVWDDGLKQKFALYIITMQNIIAEALTNLVLVIPGLFVSISLIVLSPLYKYEAIGSREARKLGIKGLKNIPRTILMSILLIILSPVGYFINKRRMKKAEVVPEKRVPFTGTPSIV